MSHPYATGEYAAGLAHMGAPFAVPEWGCHVLLRATPCGRRLDAAGPYPIAVIEQGADLEAGLDRLRAAGAVSIIVVVDDYLRPALAALESAFDFLRPFKSQYLHDRALGPLTLNKHHRYEVRKALAEVSASEIRLQDYRDDWLALYGALAERHGVDGVHAFPTAYHDALLKIAGLRAFGGFVDGRLVSAHVFMTHERYAISHLAASSPEGYDARAAYAVNNQAIADLADCDVINFGGAAGHQDNADDGLARFKRGFSNRTASSYLCGKVLDPEAYDALSFGFDGSGFFPAYRGHQRGASADDHQG